MPTIEVTQVDGKQPFLALELQCAMLFPHDFAARSSARATLVLNRLSAGPRETVTASAALVQLALQGRGLEALKKQMQDLTIQGTIAGEMLLDLLEMRKAGDRPTVAASGERQRLALLRYETFGGERKSYSERSIKAAWVRFRPVAHFWAASRLALGQLGPELWPAYMEASPKEVIAVAMDLLARASTLVSANSNGPEPLFDLTEAWAPPPDLELPPVPRGGSAKAMTATGAE